VKPIYFAYFAGLLSLLPAAARAQVLINQAALDQLAGVQAPAAAPQGAVPSIRKPAFHRHMMAHVLAVAVRPVAPVVAAPKSAPAAQPVVAKPAPAVTPAVKLSPTGAVTIAFAAGGTDLPASAAAGLQPICARAGADGLVTIDAFGAADGTDVSAPMRMSLTRAFAVRDALTACGVPAAHIIPRADGAVTGKDPDRAVVSLAAGSTGPSQ
jgi:outer membrane protein OmpA-like peptidoglycan-associated protein